MRAARWFVGWAVVVFAGCAADGGGVEPRARGDASAVGALSANDGGVDAGVDALEVMGERFARNRACAGCHGDDRGGLAGSSAPLPGTRAYAPNLTPDPVTGLGDWTDDAIVAAMRDGVDDQGARLCVMPRFGDMSDDEGRAIVAYLRSLPAVVNAVPDSVCDPVAADASSGPDAGDAGGDVADAGDVVADAGDVVADAGGCDAAVTINELETEGPLGGSDEFVELYNAGECTVSLAGWRIAYASVVGDAGVTHWTGRAGDALAPRGFAVVAGARFAGEALARFVNVRGVFSPGGGGVGLYDASGRRVDALGYGPHAMNPFVEGGPAPAPVVGGSIARVPDGADSDDGARDFRQASAPTPGAPNR